jgi:flagellar biosynthesis protein FlhF
MQEALKLVRRDLGSQAIIMSTRTVDEVRDGGSAGRQCGVEVVAAIDYEIDSSTPGTKPFSQLVKNRISPWEDPLPEKDLLKNIQRELKELKEMTKQSASFLEGDRNDATYMELKELKWMTQFLLKQVAPVKNYHFPEQLVHFYCQMLKQGVCEEIALKLINELNQDLSPDALGNRDRVRESLISKIEKELLLTDPVDLVPGGARIVALVGPTGVGKTTTAAKLAAVYALDKKMKVALVTIDTYRIAAAEQLKVYAAIMGLPFKRVSSAEELSEALVQFADMDLILIDTAGRSQRDQLQIKELKSFLRQSFAVEVCLVMSITHKEDTLSATSRQFELLPIDNIIFTKLDEVYTYGSIVNQLYRMKKPLSYLTTGQKVPEDIEIATRERIIPLILGESDTCYC